MKTTARFNSTAAKHLATQRRKEENKESYGGIKTRHKSVMIIFFLFVVSFRNGLGRKNVLCKFSEIQPNRYIGSKEMFPFVAI